jgi:hypothetical protein
MFPLRNPSINFGISQGPLERNMGEGNSNLPQHDQIRKRSRLPDPNAPEIPHMNELQGIGEIPG